MDKELKPSEQLASKQKRNQCILWIAFGCMVQFGLIDDVLCRIFKVELPLSIKSVSAVISGFGILLLLFLFSRPRQEWGTPAISKSQARNRWQLIVAVMVLIYVIVTGLMVFSMIKQQVPISMILMQQGIVALIMIPVSAIILGMIRKMLDKASQSDAPEQIEDKTGKE